MAWGNAYYEVVEPFRIFVTTGSSPSNTYIGRSRACQARLEARNAVPGSVVHSLVGGLFVVEPSGLTHEIRLQAPKPILEKSYGPTESDGDRCEALAKAGVLRPVAKPGPADYAGARERGMRGLPDNTGGVVTLEPSPQMTSLREDFGAFAAALEAAGATVRWQDIEEDSAARMQIAHPDIAYRAGVASSAVRGSWAYGEIPDHLPGACAFNGFSGTGKVAPIKDEALEVDGVPTP